MAQDNILTQTKQDNQQKEVKKQQKSTFTTTPLSTLLARALL